MDLEPLKRALFFGLKEGGELEIERLASPTRLDPTVVPPARGRLPLAA